MRKIAMLLGLSILPVSIRAQTIRLRVDAVGLTYQESREGRDAQGEGVGAGLELRLKRFGLDSRFYAARVVPDEDTLGDFDFAQIDLRLRYYLTEFIALEAGGGRRYVDPGLSAQGVGVTRLGFLSENRLNRLAQVWVRGAYLTNSRFDGGGDASIAFEFGLGVGVGTANGRFRVHAEYEFQRIDREVAARAVPMQLSLARVGLAVGL